MEMRLRRHAKGDGPWEEEQEFQLPDASGGGSSFRREAQCVKSTSQVLMALILNLDINYGCGSCSKSQGKNSASVTLPLGDALQTFHMILTSPHSAVSVTLIFLSKLVY